MTDNAEKRFAEWMRKVDAALEKKHGVTSAVIPDAPYRDMHEDGVTPVAAAREAWRRMWS